MNPFAPRRCGPCIREAMNCLSPCRRPIDRWGNPHYAPHKGVESQVTPIVLLKKGSSCCSPLGHASCSSRWSRPCPGCRTRPATGPGPSVTLATRIRHRETSTWSSSVRRHGTFWPLSRPCRPVRGGSTSQIKAHRASEEPETATGPQRPSRRPHPYQTCTRSPETASRRRDSPG